MISRALPSAHCTQAATPYMDHRHHALLHTSTMLQVLSNAPYKLETVIEAAMEIAGLRAAQKRLQVRQRDWICRVQGVASSADTVAGPAAKAGGALEPGVPCSWRRSSFHSTHAKPKLRPCTTKAAAMQNQNYGHAQPKLRPCRRWPTM